MKIYNKTHFQNKKNDKSYLENWVLFLAKNNRFQFEIQTLLGKTIVFPGTKTTSLILIGEFDKGLNNRI